MAAAAKDRTRRWEPFGVTEADFAAVPDRDGVRVVNVTPGTGGPGPGQAGWWLRGAAVALGVLAAATGLALWLLRLSLAPRSTLTGFRSWVITDCPVAPSLRPGLLAEVEAVRQDADQRIASAARQRDEVLEEAASAVRQARDEA